MQSDGTFNSLPLRVFRINWFNTRDRAADLQILSRRRSLRTDVRGDSDRRIRISADCDRPNRAHGSNRLFPRWRWTLFFFHLRQRRSTRHTRGRARRCGRRIFLWLSRRTLHWLSSCTFHGWIRHSDNGALRSLWREILRRGTLSPSNKTANSWFRRRPRHSFYLWLWRCPGRFGANLGGVGREPLHLFASPPTFFLFQGRNI